MGCITLLSDLGSQSGSAAVVKAMLSRRLPQHAVIDISHDLRPFYMPEAAYFVQAACVNLPAGTIHIVLYDVFYSKAPAMLLTERAGQYFIAPGNGIIADAFAGDVARSWNCPLPAGALTLARWMSAATTVAARLATTPAGNLGLQPFRSQTAADAKNDLHKNELSCDVVCVDQHGNVVLGITRSQIEEIARGRNFTLSFTQVEEITTVSRHYNEVAAGYKLCRFNSTGHLEICINKGRAANLFGLKPGSPLNNIKILFE